MTDEGTEMDRAPTAAEALSGLREVTGRLLATQQALIDLRTTRDDDRRVLEAIVGFGDRLRGAGLHGPFWDLVAEVLTRTFNCECSLVCGMRDGALEVLAYRGPRPDGAGERAALAGALTSGAGDQRVWTARDAGEGVGHALSFQRRPLHDLLGVQCHRDEQGAARWIVIARTLRKRAFFDPLEARLLPGLTLLGSHVEALNAMHASRSRIATHLAERDHANAVLRRRMAADREAAAEQARLRAQLAEAQKLESVGRLAGGIAHDFNNLLLVINGNAEMLLEEDGLSEDMRLMAEGVVEAGARAAALTQQLLAYSRRQVIRPEHADVNAMLASAMSSYRRLVGADVQLELQMTERDTPIMADPAQFDALIRTLLATGRDAIDESGPGGVRRIQIRTAVQAADPALRPPCPSVLIEVADTGRGMDASAAALVFEPFVSSGGGPERGGLRIATTLGVVRQNGGDIFIRSAEGLGTTFEVHWPLHTPATTPAVSPPEAAPEAAPGPVVLVVEDDQNVLRFMTRGLERHQCEVHGFSSGEEAIEFVRHSPREPEVLVTDVVMPGMNGREVADAVSSRIPSIPVLFVSGYTDDIVAQRGVVGAGVELLEKPFSVRALVSRVRRLTRRVDPGGGGHPAPRTDGPRAPDTPR